MSVPYNPPATMAELLPEIESTWNDLQHYIGGLTDQHLTDPVDAAGWAGKDHLLHLAAWMNGMNALFSGRPRHEGLGVEEAVYLSGDIDALNDAIFQANQNLTADEARSALETTFAQFMNTVHTKSEADLQQPYRFYLPDEPGDEQTNDPILNRVYGNTAHHFPEHQEYIRRIVQS